MAVKLIAVGWLTIIVLGMLAGAYYSGMRHAIRKTKPPIMIPANLLYGEYSGYHFAAIADHTGTRIYLLTYDYAYLIQRYSTMLSQSEVDMYCVNYVTRLSADNLISVN